MSDHTIEIYVTEYEKTLEQEGLPEREILMRANKIKYELEQLAIDQAMAEFDEWVDEDFSGASDIIGWANER